ncbi:MAG: tetratricopeptide repeat protein [Bacteroidia bacterium]|nr:tetratricopeptide repeat protein [Bacteroidia bacterium]
MKKVAILSLALLPIFGVAQKAKVQTAWRSLNDYEATVKDGKPDIAYLNKAKEAIDLALANEETKNQGKTHAYKARISYAQYQYSLAQELKKLEATTPDKNERAMLAYGNAPLTDFEQANDELSKIQELDPKFMETIKEGLTKGTSMLGEDDLKFAMVAQQMKMESGNIASGKYKAKKYDEAADYFYKTGFMNTMLYKVKDTSNFYNACVSAAKAKNNAKIIEYNKKMIDGKIASPYNYESLFNANIAKGDSTTALEYLRKGRVAFPNDMGLLNNETNQFLAKGKQQEALTNLKAASEKDPNNALFYLVSGNIYDNMANPKDKATGKDLDKPANFDEMFKNAEDNYSKAVALKPANDLLYNSLYNLGAMYNNYGGYLQTKAQALTIAQIAKDKTLQPGLEAKSQEFYKKAIPHLEQALTVKPDDKATMGALRKLYLLTGNEAKAKEMNDKLKAGK